MGAEIALWFDYPQLRKGRTTQGKTGQNRWFCGEVCPSQESKSARLEILSECKRLLSPVIIEGEVLDEAQQRLGVYTPKR
jgi:hypothetical protein